MGRDRRILRVLWTATLDGLLRCRFSERTRLKISNVKSKAIEKDTGHHI